MTNINKLKGSIPTPPIIKSKHSSTLMSLEQVNEIEERRKDEILFSWRFLDRGNKLFNMGKSDSSWFISLLDGLQNLSRMTTSEFRLQSESKGLRVHHHNWDKASAKYNFHDDWFEQNNENCYQFSISKANGRVHGFLIKNIFYIVWLDPLHNLYPPRERNKKVLEYEYPVTEYEVLELEYDNLEQEMNELKKDMKDCEDLLFDESH